MCLSTENLHKHVKNLLIYLKNSKMDLLHLSGTGNSQRDSHESIRTNHSQLKPQFL